MWVVLFTKKFLDCAEHSFNLSVRLRKMWAAGHEGETTEVGKPHELLVGKQWLVIRSHNFWDTITNKYALEHLDDSRSSRWWKGNNLRKVGVITHDKHLFLAVKAIHTRNISSVTQQWCGIEQLCWIHPSACTLLASGYHGLCVFCNPQPPNRISVFCFVLLSTLMTAVQQVQDCWSQGSRNHDAGI